MGQKFCYSCRVYHDVDAMELVTVSHGRRPWRCKHSIDAAKRNQVERDAFGREQSKRNQQDSCGDAVAKSKITALQGPH